MPEPTALFMEMLTSKHDPETTRCERLNEAGVFGRFVPDFGRVVAQMQYNMYHHYTVDEHTIRAIGILARIEHGEAADEHPDRHRRRCTRCCRGGCSTWPVLLHDIAKGRQAATIPSSAREIAESSARASASTEAETETVAWLVRITWR